MKKIASLIALLFFSLFINAQTEEPPKYFEFKITPTSLLNPYYTTLLSGFEFSINEKQSLQLELGFKVNPRSGSDEPERADVFDDENLMNRKFLRYKIELRNNYRFSKKYKNRPSAFFSYGLLVTPQFYDLENADIILMDGRQVEFSQAKIRRHHMALFLNWGGRAWLDQTVFLEFYTGFGFKYTRLRASDFQSPNTIAFDQERLWNTSLEDFIFRDHHAEGGWGFPFMDFGIKFGFHKQKS